MTKIKHPGTGKHSEKTSAPKQALEANLEDLVTVTWGPGGFVNEREQLKLHKAQTLKGKEGTIIVKTIDAAGNPRIRRPVVGLISVIEVKGKELYMDLGPVARAAPLSLKALQSYTADEIYSLVVPKRTLARRQKQHEPLTIEETDKALRLARVAALAEKVFGSAEKAGRWLRKPKRSLDDETPIVYLASEAGARVVEELLYQIDSGIVP